VTITAPANGDCFVTGTAVRFTANGSDPDLDPLTYTWTINGNQLAIQLRSVDYTFANANASVPVVIEVSDGNSIASDQITIQIAQGGMGMGCMGH
jgi:hypothetical protein